MGVLVLAWLISERITAAVRSLVEPALALGRGEAVAAPTEGCLKCHAQIEPMHRFGPTATLDRLDEGKDALGLTCTACHGGNPVAVTKDEAHVQPRFPREWIRDGKFRMPQQAGPLLNRESLAFVRFVNPSDLRVATTTCGSSECHVSQTAAVSKSMMRHGAMLWGAALYNNGGFPIKDASFSESYSADGAPQSLVQIPPPTGPQTRLKGILSFLDPLPRWEISQPGNILRVFERGARFAVEPRHDGSRHPGRRDQHVPQVELESRHSAFRHGRDLRRHG